jgi:SAM-dependent methyltransferase
MGSPAIAEQVIYDPAYYELMGNTSLGAARQIVPAVASLVQPQSVVDVGCGTGTWLSVFRERGIIDVLGIDGSYVQAQQLLIPKDRFLAHDLTKPISLGKRFDLAISLEVAEHLPADVASSFIDQLVGLSDIVLFSAAIPGQGGVHHINEQWQDYWRKLFEARGYTTVDFIRREFWQNPEVAFYYSQNMFLYVERKLLSSRPDIQAQAERGSALPTDLVHPRMFETAIGRNPIPNLRALLGALPAAIRRSVKWHLGIRS